MRRAIFEILRAVLTGAVLTLLVFTKSLSAYGVLDSEFFFYGMTILQYGILFAYFCCHISSGRQPLIRYFLLLAALFFAFILIPRLGLLLRVCAYLHVDPESNSQGLSMALSYLGILLLGIPFAVIGKNCFYKEPKKE